MTSYIIRRLLILPVILIGVTIIVFSMMQLLGSDKMLSAYVNPNAMKKLSIEDLEKIKEKYGLNDPLIIRYGKWIANMAKGDLGWSLVGKDRVLPSILNRLPYSIELALYAIIPIIFIGIWLGIKAAVNHNNWIDHSIRIFAIIGWSFPDYVFGIIVLIIFYLGLGWFPPGYLGLAAEEAVSAPGFHSFTRMITLDALLNGRLDIFWDALRHLIGPVITLSYLWWAYLLRITRSSMMETLRKDYVRTARAKGVSEKDVIYKHAKKNALIPIITVAGYMVIRLFMGVIIVEIIFNRPGIGSFAAKAAIQLDYASVMGSLLFTSFIMIFGNLIVDICYAFVDPRIRLN